VGREYAAGPATTETVQRLTGIPAPPAVLLRLLAGLPPLPVRMQDPRTRLDDEEGGRLLASVDGPLWQRIHLPAGAEPVRGELGDAGGLLLTFEWEALRAVEGALVPHTVRVAGAESGVRLTLRYEWVRLGEGPDPSLFDLPQPSDPGIAVRELGSRPAFGTGR